MSNTHKTSEWHQRRFAARLRDPATKPLPEGVPTQRVAVYERLFFNSIESFVRGTFPVLHGLLSAERWNSLVSDFIAQHHCRSPYFLEIGQEFIAWLQSGYLADAGDPPYMLELAHYEWVELALDTAADELPAKDEQGAELSLHSLVYPSPLAWPQAYQWPVHQIGPDCRPTTVPEQVTCLLVWRDRNDKVRFMQLTAFTFQLLNHLHEQSYTPSALLSLLAEESGLSCDDAFLTNGLALLNGWLNDDILLSAPLNEPGRTAKLS